MYDVLCLSDSCCDLIFKGLRKIPLLGTEEYCEQLYCKAGGGSNTPMGLAKLGCATAFATVIGDDSLGELVLADIKSTGVHDAYISRPAGSRTWVSAVLSTKSDRAFASYAGKSMEYTDDELLKMISSARWVHTFIHYCERFPALPGLCREAKVPLSLDAAFNEGQTLDSFRPVLEQATLFTPNEVEACGLTGMDDPAAALRKLASVCPNVVVTMGERGCIASLDGAYFSVSPADVKMADSTGAGDLFNAGLLAARLRGKDSQTQLKWAAASGSLAVTYAGGMDEAYTKEKVLALADTITVRSL